LTKKDVNYWSFLIFTIVIPYISGIILVLLLEFFTYQDSNNSNSEVGYGVIFLSLIFLPHILFLLIYSLFIGYYFCNYYKFMLIYPILIVFFHVALPFLTLHIITYGIFPINYGIYVFILFYITMISWFYIVYILIPILPVIVGFLIGRKKKMKLQPDRI